MLDVDVVVWVLSTQAAEAKAAEAAKWLTLEQLKTHNYTGCTRLPVDEKTKEDWLTDADFEAVFTMSKEAVRATLSPPGLLP